MSSRSLNKVTLIGNLTRDPEMRYTPTGTAVTTFGLATNRSWKTESGEMRDEVEFHRIVAWNKLAELCSQLLTKGRKVYLEGRLQTRTFTGSDNAQHTITEIVIDDMILLDSRRPEGAIGEAPAVPSPAPAVAVTDDSNSVGSDDSKKTKKVSTKSDKETKEENVAEEVKPAMDEDVNVDDIPF